MNWKELLNDNRLGVNAASSGGTVDGRSQFQKDFDRIVFSPAFRRLQDKTQVFPLPESDFVHTRLTHSLEVSVVGRSLGNLVGERILERNPKLKNDFTKFHFGEVVAAACLAHDIGNPPFGHSGENAIAEYFKTGEGKEFRKNINDEKKWFDLIKYEGNAQGFRIITTLQNPDIDGGLRLTLATLAAFTKYPKESFTATDLKGLTSKTAYKKFGFFQEEKNIFKEIAKSVGLKDVEESSYWWCRHPLSVLVEAADDICYGIMDLEDGFRLGLISFKETEELLMPLVPGNVLEGYKGRDENEKIGYLRAKAISELVNELADKFVDEEEKLLDGKFEDEMILVIKKASALKEINKISIEKIYHYKSVIEREVAGYEVLGGLLDTFIHAYNESYEGNLSRKNKAVVNLLPKRITTNPPDDIYLRLLNVIDFISGMTDSFAVSLFRKIKGISLPGGRFTE